MTLMHRFSHCSAPQQWSMNDGRPQVRENNNVYDRDLRMVDNDVFIL